MEHCGSIFTAVLVVVMYNKLIIYDMRRRDIKVGWASIGASWSSTLRVNGLKYE